MCDNICRTIIFHVMNETLSTLIIFNRSRQPCANEKNNERPWGSKLALINTSVYRNNSFLFYLNLTDTGLRSDWFRLWLNLRLDALGMMYAYNIRKLGSNVNKYKNLKENMLKILYWLLLHLTKIRISD